MGNAMFRKRYSERDVLNVILPYYQKAKRVGFRVPNTIVVILDGMEHWGQSYYNKIWIRSTLGKNMSKVALHEFIHTIQFYNNYNGDPHGESFQEIGRALGVPKAVLKINLDGSYN